MPFRLDDAEDTLYDHFHSNSSVEIQDRRDAAARYIDE